MSADLQEQLTRGFEKALGSQSPAVATYVAEGRGALPGAARLLAWDANSIHGFVFDTANATAIRGASEVLRKLDEDLVGGEPWGSTPRRSSSPAAAAAWRWSPKRRPGKPRRTYTVSLTTDPRLHPQEAQSGQSWRPKRCRTSMSPSSSSSTTGHGRETSRDLFAEAAEEEGTCA
jgi:hypothetical protein